MSADKGGGAAGPRFSAYWVLPAEFDGSGSEGNVDGVTPYSLAESEPPMANTYWVVEGVLLAGAYPTPLHQRIPELAGVGIRAFVDLTRPTPWRESDTYDELAAAFGGIRLSYPVTDYGVPKWDDMVATLDAIDASLDEQRPAYVHCQAGIGRTGAVVGCWLVRHGLATGDTVLAVLAELRSRDPHRGRFPSPESEVQRRLVQEWLE